MKKKASKHPRRGTSWSEVSNINFGDYRLKRNRFANRVKKEGILLVHDSPSAASLKAIPEADFGRVKVRRSNYAERIRTGGLTLQVGRERPRWCRNGSHRSQVRPAAACDLEGARAAGSR